MATYAFDLIPSHDPYASDLDPDFRRLLLSLYYEDSVAVLEFLAGVFLLQLGRPAAIEALELFAETKGGA